MDIFELKYVAMAIRKKVPLRKRTPAIFTEKDVEKEETKSSWKLKLEKLMNNSNNNGDENYYNDNNNNNDSKIKIKRNNNNNDFRYGIDRDFVKNGKRPVSQLVLYWECVWLLGSEIANRCAGWS